MDITIARGGKFTFTIDNKDLVKGLRKNKQNPRNNDALITCSGAMGYNGVLQSIDELTRLDTSSIVDGFPFPQIFLFTNMTIVCGLLKIYEIVSGSLSLKYTATTPGTTWSAVDFYDYIYLSNGREAIIRDAFTGVYSLSATQPHATAMCNYNGQVVIGAPDTDGLGVDLVLVASPLSSTSSILGSLS